MLRIIAVLFGIFFIFAGVAGFLPSFTTDNLLFGYFKVDMMYNIFLLLSGILAIMSATRYTSTRWFFIVFGLIYAFVAILGFILGGDFGFIMIHMNKADGFLQLVIALVFLYLGFSAKKA